MKTLILISFLLSSVAFTAEDAPKVKPLKKNEVKGGIVINESLQKLMDIDGVTAIYDKCKGKTPSDTDEIMKCLWEDVKNKEDLKKKVLAVYNDELKVKPDPNAARAPASAEDKKVEKPSSNLTGRHLSSTTDYESDPAVKGLSNYFGKKLEAIFDRDKALTDEERKKGIILQTDHKKFIELYKSELGKTIISAFTSYCLDTDPETCKCTQTEIDACKANPDKTAKCTCASLKCEISSTTNLTDNRKKNLDSLQNIDLSDDGPEATKWRACIFSVPNNCIKSPTTTTGSQSETVKRSCMIMDYVEAARKNIMAADAQTKFYDELGKTQTVNIANLSKELTKPEVVSSDSILEISSKDVEDSLKAPVNKDTAEFETCYKDNQIVNEKACEKFLNVNAKANEMAIAEMSLRQNAQVEALETKLNSSNEKIKEYLKEEGYTGEQISDMTEGDKIKTVKEEILNRFKNKKAAIIAEMADKINGKKSATEGRVESNPENLKKLDKIKSEFSSRSSDLSGLVKFSNIVSSYLQVKNNKSGEIQRNTASLMGEINDMSDADKKAAQQKMKNAGIKEVKPGTGETQTNLELGTINDEFLEYSTQKKKK